MWLAFLGALVALGTLGGSGTARGQEESRDGAPPSDFVDTRLTFTFGDDDVLAPEGDRIPLSPLPGFGDREGYELFYDNLDTRFTGRENLTHLVLHREMPAFAEDWTTEAALVMRLDLDEESLSDTGSYIRVRHNPWFEAPDDGFAVTLFPLDGDRFRIGYLYDLSFGGTEFVPRRAILRSPAVKLQLDRHGGTYFLGVKAVPTSAADDEILLDHGAPDPDPIVVRQMQYAVLGGAGWDLLSDTLRADVGGGFFQQGELDLVDYPDRQLFAAGGAARIAYHRDLPVGESIDLSLYRNDPNRPFREFLPAEYVPGQLGWLVSLEGAFIEHRVADVDSPGELTMQPAMAAALQARMQWDYLRVELTGVFRDISFLMRNTEGYLPFTSLPERADTSPEIFGALAADYHFPEPRITLGISGGLSLPATLETDVPAGTLPLGRVLVVGSGGRVSILRAGDAADPVIAARVHGRVDLSEMLWALAWVQYVRDPNTAPLIVRTAGGSGLLLQQAHQLGFGLSVAARF